MRNIGNGSFKPVMLPRIGEELHGTNLEAAQCRLPKCGPGVDLRVTALKKKKKKVPKSLREAIDRSKLAVVPYLHGVTHNIKKIAAREG